MNTRKHLGNTRKYKIHKRNESIILLLRDSHSCVLLPARMDTFFFLFLPDSDRPVHSSVFCLTYCYSEDARLEYF